MRRAHAYIGTGCGVWIPSGGWHALPWSAVIHDPDLCWSAERPTRLAVPEAWGACWIRAVGQCWYNFANQAGPDGVVPSLQHNVADARGVRIDKNGSQFYQGSGNVDFIENGSSTNSCQVSTAEILAQPGDYFELMVAQLSPNALPFKGSDDGAFNWMQLVRLESA